MTGEDIADGGFEVERDTDISGKGFNVPIGGTPRAASVPANLPATALAVPSPPCPYRKSNPDVLVMQSSQERRGNDAASGLDRTRNRCILAQR